MHPRNIYNTPPDFSDLAIRYPEFLRISKLDINGKVKIDFKDQNTLRILTKCLLHSDFGLNVDIPPNRLVPTVPLRLNYLLWLEDILEAAGIKDNIYGIDIGTGACCIYPLLAANKFKWKMLATEVNENSVNMAYKNVRQNKLEDFITVKKVDDRNKLITHCFKSFGGTLDAADFCMCNPPFYASAEDMDISRTPTRDPPNNARTGMAQEIITEGGEVEFVKKLFEESLQLKDRIKIYTTMLGHKSSLKPLLKTIKGSGISQVSHTNFVQGKTMRWGLAWSFVDAANLNKTHCVKKPKAKNQCMCFEIPPLEGLDYKVKDVALKLLQIFKTIDLEYKVLQNTSVICTMEVKAAKNTWSQQRKRRREQKQLNNKVSTSSEEKQTNSCENHQNILVNSPTSAANNGNNVSQGETIHEQDIKNQGISDYNLVQDGNNSKRKIEDEDVECPKRIKINGENNDKSVDSNIPKFSEPSSSGGCGSSEPCSNNNYLSMAVCVRLNQTSIVLEVGYVSGTAGKDGVHQIVQYIKNNWK